MWLATIIADIHFTLVKAIKTSSSIVDLSPEVPSFEINSVALTNHLCTPFKEYMRYITLMAYEAVVDQPSTKRERERERERANESERERARKRGRGEGGRGIPV